MENFLFYLLKSGIWITIFWLIYWLFLRKETFFKFNRFFLLAGLFASFALAFCQYRYPVNINLQVGTASGNVVEQTVAQSSGWEVSWPLIVVIIYVSIAFILWVYHLVGLSKISRLVWKEKSSTHTKPPIIETTEVQSPFSFFGYIFMNKESQLSDIEKNLILEHETAHVEQHHWIDLFLSQTVCALQWFNPFAWLYRDAIKQNHEFLADQSVVRKGYSQAVYQAALINYTLKAPVFVLTSSFAYHKFKRIIMMKKTVSKSAKKFAALLLIPALAVFLWAFAEPEYKYSIVVQSEVVQSEPEVMIPEEPVVVATDKKIDIVSSHTHRVLPDKIDSATIENPPHFGFEVTSHTRDTISGRIIEKTIIANRGSEFRLNGMKPAPLFIVDDKEVASIDDVNSEDTKTVTILKSQSAIDLYGDKGKNGVISIYTEKYAGESNENAEIHEINEVSLSKNLAAKEIQTMPILILDGKEISSIDGIKPEDIESISVLKDETSTKAFGEKGKNGVIIIFSKKYAGESKDEGYKRMMYRRLKSINVDKQKPNVLNLLYVVDGEVYDSSPDNFHDRFKPEDIESISIMKDKESIDTYGERGKNGVVIIKTKK